MTRKYSLTGPFPFSLRRSPTVEAEARAQSEDEQEATSGDGGGSGGGGSGPRAEYVVAGDVESASSDGIVLSAVSTDAGDANEVPLRHCF